MMDFGKKYGVQEAIMGVWKKEGIAGFYSGLKIDVFRVLPQNVIVFMCYEYVRKWMMK